MVHKHEGSATPTPGRPPSMLRQSIDGRAALVADGFSPSYFEDESKEAPPPYGETHNQLQFSQSGFDAGANVTGMVPSCLPLPRTVANMGYSSPRRRWPCQYKYQSKNQEILRPPRPYSPGPGSRGRCRFPRLPLYTVHSTNPRR